MSWRVVVVSNRCKLEYKLGYLVCRGEEVKKVFLSEIGVLIVESTAVSMTAALLCELVKNKIDVVFCDEKHNPQSQLLALNGRHDASGCLKKQLAWKSEAARTVWTEIVRLKIERQYYFLREQNAEQAELLLVDRFVFGTGQELTPQYKHALCDILNQKVRIGKESYTVSAAVGIYCRSMFEALETGDIGKIKCYEL